MESGLWQVMHILKDPYAPKGLEAILLRDRGRILLQTHGGSTAKIQIGHLIGQLSMTYNHLTETFSDSRLSILAFTSYLSGLDPHKPVQEGWLDQQILAQGPFTWFRVNDHVYIGYFGAGKCEKIKLSFCRKSEMWKSHRVSNTTLSPWPSKANYTAHTLKDLQDQIQRHCILAILQTPPTKDHFLWVLKEGALYGIQRVP